ncbi:MAG TPA: hypothetical protein VJU83_10005 [Burkholderiales bacterium]|nr:hypothetical protein [Burkholderiales bacterium]
MKQASDNLQTRAEPMEDLSETKNAKKSPSPRSTRPNEGPATQWPGPLDAPLSFSER